MGWLDPPGLSEPELRKRTLTNLSNKPPTWLKQADERLDRAVYGWEYPLNGHFCQSTPYDFSGVGTGLLQKPASGFTSSLCSMRANQASGVGQAACLCQTD